MEAIVNAVGCANDDCYVDPQILQKVISLLDWGEDVNADNVDGTTALMMAASHGITNVVRCLLERGADVYASDLDGKTVLMHATEPGIPFLGRAKDRDDTLRLLLDHGADVNAKDVHGNTTLVRMVAAGHCPMISDWVRLLLEHGANVNSVNSKGNTILMMIVYRLRSRVEPELPKINLVKLLIEQGANVNSRNKKGWTALRVALELGFEHYSAAQLLVEAGASVSLAANDGSTVISTCQESGERGKEVLRWLAKMGNPEAADLIAREERDKKREQERIRDRRIRNKECIMCGKPLGFIDMLLRRRQHKGCFTFQG